MSSAVAYVMSDFASVRLPETAGGCGEQHQATADADGYLRFECDRCAPASRRATGGNRPFTGR